ncbi:MAG: hypothetical protein V4631_20465 [Pseudomonadota bacterium]
MNKITAILIAGLFASASSIAQTTVTTTTVKTPAGAVIAADAKDAKAVVKADAAAVKADVSADAKVAKDVVKADAAAVKAAAKPKAHKRTHTHARTVKKTTTYSLKVPKKVTVTTE